MAGGGRFPVLVVAPTFYFRSLSHGGGFRAGPRLFQVARLRGA